MSKPGAPSTYRDELAAAQARIAALEEKLAAVGRSEEGEAADEDDDDPAIAKLVEERKTAERTARHGPDWKRPLVAGVAVVFAAGFPFLTAHPPRVASMSNFMMGAAIAGVVVAVLLHLALRGLSRQALPLLDAKIAELRKKRAEARRLHTIERELHEVRAALTQAQEGGAGRARIAVDDEAEAEEEAAEVAPRRMRRGR